MGAHRKEITEEFETTGLNTYAEIFRMPSIKTTVSVEEYSFTYLEGIKGVVEFLCRRIQT